MESETFIPRENIESTTPGELLLPDFQRRIYNLISNNYIYESERDLIREIINDQSLLDSYLEKDPKFDDITSFINEYFIEDHQGHKKYDKPLQDTIKHLYLGDTVLLMENILERRSQGESTQNGGTNFVYSDFHAQNMITYAQNLIHEFNSYKQALEAEKKSENNTRHGTMTRISELESENKKLEKENESLRKEKTRLLTEEAERYNDLHGKHQKALFILDQNKLLDEYRGQLKGGKTRRRKGKKGKRTRKH